MARKSHAEYEALRAQRSKDDPHYAGRAVKLRLSERTAHALEAKAIAAGVDRSAYVALLVASEGSPEHRLQALGELSRAALAVSEISDGLRRLQGEVSRANGSVRSLFIDAYAAAIRSKPELDDAARELLRAADKIDDYLRALEPEVKSALAALRTAVEGLHV